MAMDFGELDLSGAGLTEVDPVEQQLEESNKIIDQLKRRIQTDNAAKSDIRQRIEELRDNQTIPSHQREEIILNLQQQYERLATSVSHNTAKLVGMRHMQELNASTQLLLKQREENLKEIEKKNQELSKANMEILEEAQETILHSKEHCEMVEIEKEEMVRQMSQLEIDRDHLKSQLRELQESRIRIPPVPSPRNQSLNTLPEVPSLNPGSDLRDQIFDFQPGTVNNRRGAATYNTAEQAFSFQHEPKRVHFETSTPRPKYRRDISPDINNGKGYDQDDDFTGIRLGTLDKKEVEFRPTPAPRISKAQFTNRNPLEISMALAASEFKKMREPKIKKFKGGYSSDERLIFQNWKKDLQHCIADRHLNNQEAIQLVKDYSEGYARREVDFYLDTSENQTFEELLAHLNLAFTGGEDEATLFSEFYGRSQKARESEDAFADDLQILARKIINIKPEFRLGIDKVLKHQYANNLKDQYYSSIARALLVQLPTATFTKYRSELALVIGARTKSNRRTNLTTSGIESETETPKLSRPQIQRRKKAQKVQQSEQIQQLERKLDQALEETKKCQRMLDQKTTAEFPVRSNAVGNSYNKNSNTNYNNKPTNRYAGYAPKPFLGTPRPSKVAPGANGETDPEQTCNYCKDTGHLKTNCSVLMNKLAKDSERVRAAQLMYQKGIPNKSGNK